MRKITNCFTRERMIYNGKNAVPTGEFLRTESGEFEKEILCFEERMTSTEQSQKKSSVSPNLKSRIMSVHLVPAIKNKERILGLSVSRRGKFIHGTLKKW